jgi:very-short-patch-repair endonuclease
VEPAQRATRRFEISTTHPIPPYVVDFVCLSEKLVIELDGSQHTQATDATRTRFLELQGFRVLRFWDNDALM